MNSPIPNQTDMFTSEIDRLVVIRGVESKLI
jgi:hypothetical protein